jgi:hypothetical protein
MNILFKKDGNSYRPGFVEKCVRNFGKSYNETVCKVINNSSDGLNNVMKGSSLRLAVCEMCKPDTCECRSVSSIVKKC